ncbi:MAG TPA: BON domain-containing protein [Longimicrobiales bacterium]
MARYGRGSGRGGRGGWAGEERGYGWAYGGPGRWAGRRARVDYGAPADYEAEWGYGERMGYDVESGYGAAPEYAEEFGPPYADYGYDYEYGGRGWPYRGAYGGPEYGYEWRRSRAYDWELAGPEDFGMRYGFEYIRRGPRWYRRTRGRRPWGRERRREAGYGVEGAPRYYGGEYTGRRYGGRYLERGYGERQRPEVRYGHTPEDRWPSEGHDLDHRPARERDMTDGEIREAVLENLFQDTWIDPARIDAHVENGVVTLTGEVNDFMEARYAWDDAWESAGVRGVINNLTVRADQPQEEMELPQTSGGRKPPAGRRASR